MVLLDGWRLDGQRSASRSGDQNAFSGTQWNPIQVGFVVKVVPRGGEIFVALVAVGFELALAIGGEELKRSFLSDERLGVKPA